LKCFKVLAIYKPKKTIGSLRFYRSMYKNLNRLKYKFKKPAQLKYLPKIFVSHIYHTY